MTGRAENDVHFDCLLGRCDTFRAEVYVRARLPPGLTGGSVQGTLTGPECRWATTLPVTARLGPSPGNGAPDVLVTRAILTEPSYWTPDLPNCYRLEAAVTVAGTQLATCRRTVGLRRLGVRGRSLWLDGRRFVPRGFWSPAEAIDLESYRQAGLTAVVADPAEDFLDQCDTEGVAVIARLSAAGRSLTVEEAGLRIAAWAGHPSVLVAILPLNMPADLAPAVLAETKKSTRGTLLVAPAVDGTQPPGPPPPGADLMVLELPADRVPHPLWQTENLRLPLIACRSQASAAVVPSRRPCDALQADLATWATAAGRPPDWDWAGYLALPGHLA